MFDYLLSLVLAHSIVYETKSTLSPNGIVDDALNGPDPQAQPVGDSTSQQLQAYTQNLPSLLQATANQSLPVGQALQNTSNTIAPQQQSLLSNLFASYAPGLYNTGNQLNQQNAAAGVSQASGLLSGAGGNLLQQLQQTQQQLDPQFYATRQAESGKIGDLLNSIDLNGLTGSERAEVERSNNQQDASRGLLNTPSQTATTQNAMNFGSALAAKQGRLSQAIQTATSFLPSSQSGISSFTGTGAATTQANPGAAQFGGTSGSTAGASNAFDMGNSLLGGINSTANNAANINANRRDTLDRVTGVLGSLPNIS